MAMESGKNTGRELELGQRIQKFRKQKGLTQQGLCYKSNLSYSTLAKIERGAIRSPSVFTIESIAESLNVSIDKLVGRNFDVVAQKSNKTSKSGISFVYFDVNGCLVRRYQKAFIKIAQDYQLSSDRVEAVFWNYNERINRGLITIDQFNTLLAKKLNIKEINWSKYYLEAVETVPGIKELVKWIALHYKIGLLTNIMPTLLDQLIVLNKIPNIDYDVIIDSSKVGLVKPENKIFKLATEKSGVSSNEILLVDDTRMNLIAASKAGWHDIWFDFSSPEDSIKTVKTVLEFA
jgi:FMN phosphatase YigB (HAD superfamily)